MFLWQKRASRLLAGTVRTNKQFCGSSCNAYIWNKSTEYSFERLLPTDKKNYITCRPSRFFVGFVRVEHFMRMCKR